ncbi:hypothetical protein HMPREF1981_01687 [Bacteroides pyogenes F0041]|uniref:Uncharacterized protein n=1 Tax=Bacteroides pyogenes F0041 TaxID=1321819 RepID=U2CN68_9BACE|nr:hypothetical protein HMPREF1981_01687 [Bacteroides pyogenes F0041]
MFNLRKQLYCISGLAGRMLWNLLNPKGIEFRLLAFFIVNILSDISSQLFV